VAKLPVVLPKPNLPLQPDFAHARQRAADISIFKLHGKWTATVRDTRFLDFLRAGNCLRMFP